MKTILHTALVFCLAFGLFAFPSSGLADDGQPEDPPPADGTVFQDGEPVMPVSEEDLAPPDLPENEALLAPVTAYKTLTGLDFHPVDSDMTYSSTNGGLYSLALVPGFGFSAALNLPSGATVTGITFFVVDNSATEDVELSASRYNPATGVTGHISGKSSTVNSPNIEQVSLTTGLPFFIENSTYAYRLRVEFGAAGEVHKLYGARITYNLSPSPHAGDDYLSMAGADFRSSSSFMTYAASGGMLYATALDPTYNFKTRLDLPDGAVINHLDYYVIDNHADSFNLGLYSHSPANDHFMGESADSTSGLPLSTAVQVVSRTVSLRVDNKTKSYSILFTPLAASSGLKIVGARVRYNPPRARQAVQWKTISGGNFTPSGSSLTYRTYGSNLYALVLSTGRSFQAGLDLPDGVRISKIIFYVKDNNAADMSLAARYYYPTIGSYTDPRTGSSTGASTAIQAIAFSGVSRAMGIVDTYQKVYRLRASPGGTGTTMLLVGARVEYFDPNVYLPAVMK